MPRHDLRDRYPFHTARNPRQHITCCARPTYRRGLRHWLKARIARLRLLLGV